MICRWNFYKNDAFGMLCILYDILFEIILYMFRFLYVKGFYMHSNTYVDGMFAVRMVNYL